MINQNLKILHTASFFLYLSLQSLHYYSLFLLCTSSYCIKKSTFRANTHTYPIFLFCLLFLWSSPVEQSIKSEVLMTTTSHILQWLSQQNLKILLLCTAQDYNIEISHLILSQIFDTARNAYCILSDQYTDNSSCFFLL